MGRVQLGGDEEMFDGLLQISLFLNQFVSKPVTAEKALRIFGNHLSERVKIHAGFLVTVAGMLPLEGRREPDF